MMRSLRDRVSDGALDPEVDLVPRSTHWLLDLTPPASENWNPNSSTNWASHANGYAQPLQSSNSGLKSVAFGSDPWSLDRIPWRETVFGNRLDIVYAVNDMRFVTKTLLKGLTVLAPVVVTFYILRWLVGAFESATQGVVRSLFPGLDYVPGMGVVSLIVITFLVGLLMYSWIVRKIWKRFDQLFRNTPAFSSIYSPVSDLMEMFSGGFSNRLGKPVMVTIPGTQMETLAFVTRDDLSGAPDGFAKDDHIVVFIQWSSQLGGYCFILPRDSVREVDMTVEEALRWSLTAGLTGGSGKRESASASPDS